MHLQKFNKEIKNAVQLISLELLATADTDQDY